jgi:hypothetical protein
MHACMSEGGCWWGAECAGSWARLRWLGDAAGLGGCGGRPALARGAPASPTDRLLWERRPRLLLRPPISGLQTGTAHDTLVSSNIAQCRTIAGTFISVAANLKTLRCQT